MIHWLEALCALPSSELPAVLVSVLAVEGSTPRADDAKMLVFRAARKEFADIDDADDIGETAAARWRSVDTIGGGHLEMQAIALAGEMLISASAQCSTLDVADATDATDALALPPPRRQRFALGPSLGQCCGGAMELVWEVIGPAQQQLFQQMRTRQQQGLSSYRFLRLPMHPMHPKFNVQAKQQVTQQAAQQDFSAASQITMLLQDQAGQLLAQIPKQTQKKECAQALTSSAQLPPKFTALGNAAPAAGKHTQLLHTPESPQHPCEAWLLDTLLPHQATLYLFGAGHVAQALVQALSALPCQIVWIDEREEMFPAQSGQAAALNSVQTAQISMQSHASPLQLLRNAPDHACFLVMTHSHQLDLELAQAILSRPQLAWFGLIGSHSKRQMFRKRLAQRGLSEARIEQMVCPIGLPGINGKQPAVIAASVTAQLLQVWQNLQQKTQQDTQQTQLESRPSQAMPQATISSTSNQLFASSTSLEHHV